MQPTIISKWFDTMQQAESYQMRLYSKYNFVKLAIWPRFTECGLYTFAVHN